MPLAKGYSRDTIARNIRSLVREGVPQKQAEAIAYKEAREWFEHYNPRATLPIYLSGPRPNPVRDARYAVVTWHESPIYKTSEAVKTFYSEKLAQAFANKENTKGANYVVRELKYMRDNPIKSLTDQAKRRYSGFMMKAPTRQETRTVPALPKVALAIGEVVEIHYASKRGGRMHIYRHVFKSGSRPLLASSHDGKQLILLGGAFRFTSRGIVDR